jgi:hypothetical protein
MRGVTVAPMSVFSRESKATSSGIAAAVGLALRYPTLCNDPSTAWRSWAVSTFE